MQNPYMPNMRHQAQNLGFTDTMARQAPVGYQYRQNPNAAPPMGGQPAPPAGAMPISPTGGVATPGIGTHSQAMEQMRLDYERRNGAPDPNAIIGRDGMVPRMANGTMPVQQPGLQLGGVPPGAMGGIGGGPNPVNIAQQFSQRFGPQFGQVFQQPQQPAALPDPGGGGSHPANGPNPYLGDQANAITSQVTKNLQRNILPGINSGAIAAGGFGGSRQGIAQGLAIGDTNQGLSNALAGLYGNAYGQDRQLQVQQDMQRAALSSQQNIAQMNNQTQRDLGFGNLGLGYTQAGNAFGLGMGNLALGNKQADQSWNLGLGGLDNARYGMDQGFYTQQRGQDLQQMGLGSQLMNQGNLGLQQGGQGLYNVGQQQQQAPWQALQQYSQLLSPFTGYGQTQSQTTPGASKWGSALGGAMTLAQLWGLLNGGQG